MKVNDITYLYPELLKIARYHNATLEDSQDVVQDLFFKLSEIQNKEGNIDRIVYKGQINMVYLFNAIKNMVNNKHTRHNNRFHDTEIPEIQEPEYSLTQIEIEEQLIKMGGYYHKLYKSFFNQKISIRKFARETNISAPTVCRGVNHIRRKLRPLFYDTRTKDTME